MDFYGRGSSVYEWFEIIQSFKLFHATAVSALNFRTLRDARGLWRLDGQTLYAVTGSDITTVELSEDFASGEMGEVFSSESFKSPTTIAMYDERLLVVNSQFDARESGNPELPFTVSDVSIP